MAADQLVCAAAKDMPDFKEGMTMTTLTGQVIRIFSTIQAAWEWNDGREEEA